MKMRRDNFEAPVMHVCKLQHFYQAECKKSRGRTHDFLLRRLQTVDKTVLGKIITTVREAGAMCLIFYKLFVFMANY